MQIMNGTLENPGVDDSIETRELLEALKENLPRLREQAEICRQVLDRAMLGFLRGGRDSPPVAETKATIAQVVALIQSVQGQRFVSRRFLDAVGVEDSDHVSAEAVRITDTEHARHALATACFFLTLLIRSADIREIGASASDLALLELYCL
jgi:hypothetical protein